MTPEPPLSINNIALCLSGGGYRAAAYHLGAMRTLNDLRLLDKVKYISTASGGTITAMKYVTDKIERDQKFEFDDFFNEMSAFLVDVNVVKDAFEILEVTPCPDGTNDLSLIRSAAQVYREKLIGPHTETIEGLEVKREWTLADLEATEKFNDLIFNSSEFRTGNAFRLRVGPADRDFYFGNSNTRVKETVWTQLSPADVVAATSCFPGVFEPIRFPQDFQMKDRSVADDPFINKNPELTTVALMDGGILDNQGVAGMTVSYKTDPLPFDLMIVSDTAAREDNILDYKIEERKVGISLGLLTLVVLAVLGFFIFASISTIVTLDRSPDRSWPIWLGLLVTSVAGLISLILLELVVWAVLTIRSLNVMGDTFPIWSYIRRLSVGDLWTLISGRLFSTKAMTFQVFMKRIRDLQFANTMSAIGRNTRANLYNGRTVFSMIYRMVPRSVRLAGEKTEPLHTPELQPTERMVTIAKDAGCVGTKLWLDKEELNTLIDCGRITVCLALLAFVWKDNESLAEQNTPNSLFGDLYKKWMELKAEFAD